MKLTRPKAIVLSLLSITLYFVTRSHALALSTSSVQHVLSGKGVLSLCIVDTDIVNNPDSVNVIAGTKRGSLIQCVLSNNPRNGHGDDDIDGNDESSVLQQFDISTQTLSTSSTNAKTKPYPIYSMTTLHATNSYSQSTAIACGGGDRYLTLWRAQQQPQPQTRKEWSMEKRLGPHTGWVRDVLHDSKQSLLFSIGCNSIEIWQWRPAQSKQLPIRKNGGGRQRPSDHDHKNNNNNIIDESGKNDDRFNGWEWQSNSKLCIDSSPVDGCTLSSDLLCLCTDNTHNPSFLYAGGVDGRIHRWNLFHVASTTTIVDNFHKPRKKDIGLEMSQSHQSIAAHKGRVLKMVVGERTGMLFSIGGDGTLQCRNLLKEEDKKEKQRATEDISHGAVASLAIGSDAQANADANAIRLSTMCLLKEEKQKCTIIVASSCGRLFTVTAERRRDGDIEMMKLSKRMELTLDGEPVIHALACAHLHCDEDEDKDWDCFVVVIGHSNGLSLWCSNNSSKMK